jgi:hypothetical protein
LTTGAKLTDLDLDRGPDQSTPRSLVLPGLDVVAPGAALPADIGPLTAPGADWTDVDGRLAVRTSLHASGALVDVVGVATYVVSDPTDVVVAVPVAGRPDADVVDAFDRSVLPLVLAYRGAHYLHASAVSTADGVVALCGTSGTGKSTVAAALGRLGYGFWGDDAVVFATRPAPQPPVSVRLPSALRLDDAARGLVHRCTGAGALAAVTEPGALGPLAAVVVLERAAGATPTLDRLRPGPALSTVLQHVLCFSLHGVVARRHLVEDYLAMVAAVPVLRLRFPAVPNRFPAILELMSARLGPPPRG